MVGTAVVGALLLVIAASLAMVAGVTLVGASLVGEFVVGAAVGGALLLEIATELVEVVSISVEDFKL